MEEKTVFEKSVKGRKGYSLETEGAAGRSPGDFLPRNLQRKSALRLPELSELDVVQHYTRLSQTNYSIDTHFYPLGSCTMKYNPRINEEVSAWPGFAATHPLQYQFTVQGNLRLMYELGEMLKIVTNMDAVTLQPAAGAHGELTGILMMRAYHAARGNPRSKVVIPDSAHGTNPSSAHIAGYHVVTLKTGADGMLDPKALAAVMDEDVACLMLTNPSTLGIFEKNIRELAEIVHGKGGLVYCDGANLNAVMGKVRMGDLGVDCMHINLHKTFTTPHGGGGPGAGPVVVKKILEPYLPKPVVVKQDNKYHLDFDRPHSIGRMRAFYGNFGMFVRAYAYMREMGAAGLKRASELAVLNANYVRARLAGAYSLAYEAPSMHEVVFSDKAFKGTPVKTMDVAKRLLDYGFHSPTVYFPIIVSGAIMIEPTETASKQALDEFCDAMLKIREEIASDPAKLLNAPTTTFRGRLDEVLAVKEPKLREKF